MSEETKYKKLLNEWGNLKEYQKKYDRKQIDECFNSHIKKIVDSTMKIEDFAGNGRESDCTYLTTFLETKSRKIYGSARPGNMFNNGIYFSNDPEYKESPYFISQIIHGYENIDKKIAIKITKQNKSRVYFKQEIAQELFQEKLLPFLRDIVLSNNVEIYKQIEQEKYVKDNKEITKPMGSTQILRKIIAMKNIGTFLYIYSDKMINVLYKFFVSEQDTDLTNIEKNKKIVNKLQEIGFIKRKDEELEDYIINLSHFIWDKFDSTIDLSSKNIILHGAPGTGKTYMTNKSIENNLSILNSQNINKQYKLVQFHPSFGYEEFIDGIKPKSLTSTGGIQLELVNGIFKDMCIDAFKELTRFNKLTKEEKKKDEIKKFYFVADEINRAELSRVFGELLLCLEEDKRLSFNKNGKLIGTKIKTQNASLWQKEHAVVIMKDDEVFTELDEDGNYAIEKDDEKNYDYYFGVPENLYFIGTMNDIDRSVDSFDMALRRRFIWKHYPYDEKIVEENYLEKSNTDKKIEELSNYLKNCKSLNDYIVSEDGFNLPEAYMLGQSYFMDLKSFSDINLKKRWDEKIAPLLTEYLRVNFEGKDLIDKLKEAKEKFIPKKNS